MLRAGPFRSKVAATAVWVTRHHISQSIQGQTPFRNSLYTFHHFTIAYLHLVEKRLIDNIFVHFYLITI